MDQQPLYTGERRELFRFIPYECARILDVGCSTGDLGAALKRGRSVTVFGIEINPTAAREAQHKLDAVFEAPLAELDFSSDKDRFHCIIFADVLEHLVDPLQAVLICKQWLAPDGVMIFSIPNVNHFSVLWDLVVCGNWQYRESGILDNTHLRFFTHKSFCRLLDEAGLVILEDDAILSLKGSRIFNILTFSLLRRFFVAQYLFKARLKR